MNSIDPGQLNRLASVQRRALAPGDFGHAQEVWTPVASVWVSLRPVGGRELLASMAVRPELTHTVMARYNAALLPALTATQWRIVLGPRHFNILAAREVADGRQWLVFDCQEGGADGH